MIRKLIGPDYPKTSCECVECEPKIPLWPARKARERDTNNLGLESKSQLKDISECESTSYVTSMRQPSPWLKKDKYELLNPNFGLTEYPGFFHDASASKCDCNGCENTVTAFDPRLINSMRGGAAQQLDRPPLSGEVLLKDIYEDSLTNYGKHYKNYSDIHAGQIMYYLDKDIDPTYSLPVYTVRSDVNSDVYKTPMGGLWPRYPKCPLTKDSQYLSPQQFTRDTVTHREDLMALQTARFNREKYPIDLGN